MTVPRSYLLGLIAAGALALGAPLDLAGQGCEPVRFVTPVRLGAAGEAYLLKNEWEVGLSYRRLASNEYFVGNESKPSSGPSGRPPEIKINAVIASFAYSFSYRFRVSLLVPFSDGSLNRLWADTAMHKQKASGLGDVTVMAESWLRHPKTNPNGNVQLGFGIKAPTGSYTKSSTFYNASGPVTFAADNTIQPGDGGWGLIGQVNAFRLISSRASAYASGSYMASPKATSSVTQSPAPTAFHWAVPDVWSARAGFAGEPFEQHELSFSLGLRMDGTPVHDLIGGGDSASVKRSFSVVYADPGFSYTHDRSTFALGVPIRMSVNRVKSLTEQAPGGGVNGGGFAKRLIFVSYSRRY